MVIDMQKTNLKALVENGGFQFTNTFFPYTSGQIGPYYVQSVDITKNGQDYCRAISDLKELIILKLGVNSFDVISGGESRDWDFSNPVATEMVKPHAKIYKNGKILGADMDGKQVVHVADLSNEGSSPRDLWVPAIRKAGGDISHIFFYVDRMEDGVEEMEKLGLYSEAVIPLNQVAWDYLRQLNVVNEEIYRQLSERGSTKEEREDWARKMLRSDEGLKTLVNLFSDPKTKEKGWKILNKGYPDLKDELIIEVEKRGIKLLEEEK